MRLIIPEKAQILFLPARFKGLRGGRGSAKSHSGVRAALARGIVEPLFIKFFREIHKSIEDSVKGLLDNCIAELGLQSFYTSEKQVIYGANGTVIKFGGLRSNVSSIKSTEGVDIAIIEEAEAITEASLNVLRPTIRKRGSEIWAFWNPRNESDAIEQLLVGPNRMEQSVYADMNWRDNPFFSTEMEIERLYDKKRDPDLYEHIWEGKYQRNSNARVFKNVTIDDIDDRIPDNTPPRYGADWGFRNPSCLVEVYIWDDIIYVRREVSARECPISLLPSLFAGTHPEGRWNNPLNYPGIPQSYKYQIVGDSSRPETIHHLNALGFKIVPSKKGAGSVIEGVEFLQRHNMVIHPSCKGTKTEVENYKHKIDPLTQEILPTIANIDNHFIDSIRYAVQAAIKAKKRRKAVPTSIRGYGPDLIF